MQESEGGENDEDAVRLKRLHGPYRIAFRIWIPRAGLGSSYLQGKKQFTSPFLSCTTSTNFLLFSALYFISRPQEASENKHAYVGLQHSISRRLMNEFNARVAMFIALWLYI
jgi:hypothetical protein